MFIMNMVARRARRSFRCCGAGRCPALGSGDRMQRERPRHPGGRRGSRRRATGCGWADPQGGRCASMQCWACVGVDPRGRPQRSPGAPQPRTAGPCPGVVSIGSLIHRPTAAERMCRGPFRVSERTASCPAPRIECSRDEAVGVYRAIRSGCARRPPCGVPRDLLRVVAGLAGESRPSRYASGRHKASHAMPRPRRPGARKSGPVELE